MLKRFAKGQVVSDRMLVAQLKRDVKAEGGVKAFARNHRLAPWSLGRLFTTKGATCNPGPKLAKLYGLSVQRRAIIYVAAR